MRDPTPHDDVRIFECIRHFCSPWFLSVSKRGVDIETIKWASFSVVESEVFIKLKRSLRT